VGSSGRETRLTVALDQLELSLDGVEPLSAEERVQRWISQQSDETPAVLAGWLFLRDEISRAARAHRWAELRDAEVPFHRESGLRGRTPPSSAALVPMRHVNVCLPVASTPIEINWTRGGYGGVWGHWLMRPQNVA
jgi:hypothetical protein